MDLPYEWTIGWRYTRAGRGGRRNRFVGFISAVSVLGIGLGVAALIVVLSVMNGFQREVRDRLLAVLPQVEVSAADGRGLADWPALAARLRRTPAVTGVAPYVQSQALAAHGASIAGVRVRGVLPAAEGQVTDLARAEPALYARLEPGAWRIVLGAELARRLGVRLGDAVTVTAPTGEPTPAGPLPRLKAFTLAGVYASGQYEIDSALALVHLDDAARLFRSGGAGGVQLRLARIEEAPAVAARLARELGPGYEVRDWTRSNRNWYEAVQLEKRMMFIILLLIVAVAAFNLVATLVMTVTDKAADIAILRTLGASPRSVMGVFVVQGALAGIAGTAGGLALGLVVALHIDVIVPAIERALGVSFFPASVYVISRMPSEPLAADIVPVVVCALVLAFVATLYPSWRAARLDPAEALRHE